MRVGLEVLLEDRLDRVRGAKVGLLCNHTAVDRHMTHAADLLKGAGVDLVRLFAPEHGVRATVQDMIGLDEQRDPVTGLPVVSLYAHDAASLKPRPEVLADLDLVVFDIQDVGARYYTYQATLGFVMQVAGPLGVKVIVLDRPNPITGTAVEGNVVNPGFESFVGAFPLAVRHGMTVGELARYFGAWCGVDCEVEVVPCEGWSRRQWYDQLDRPFVFPSPNMPTVDTATVYPGTCLVEGTNLSEGRGTTRPFHLVGAPWLDPQAFAAECTRLAAAEGLEGALFRPHAFLPGFQKHAGKQCGGVEIHVVDRDRLHALLLGMIVVAAARNVDPEHFGWRTATYEFVDDPIAIDLLTGSSEYRATVGAGGSLRALVEAWEPQRRGFLTRREGCLLYR